MGVMAGAVQPPVPSPQSPAPSAHLCAVVVMASTTSMMRCSAESVPMVMSVPQKSLSMEPTSPTMFSRQFFFATSSLICPVGVTATTQIISGHSCPHHRGAGAQSSLGSQQQGDPHHPLPSSTLGDWERLTHHLGPAPPAARPTRSGRCLRQ